MSKNKATYIIQNITSLPGYDRAELKVGMVVELDEEFGDAYAKRHILKKGIAVKKTNQDVELESLKKENSKLKSELESLKKDKTLKNGKG